MSDRPCETCARDELGSAELHALVDAHRALLARVARAEGMVGEDVFDVVQEAFVAYLGRAAPSANPRRTLVAFARNLARNRRRLHATARPHLGDEATLDALADPDDDAEDQLVAAEDHARLECCVARLADVQRAVVTLRMLDELSGSDVAKQLGVTPGHVAVLLHRAKSALAHCLTEES
jgi:RNA polymerase sigma-70 factor (ECF subfamily)